MKFLCLHGYGTSGAIFEKQITAIRYALGDEHEWVFLDGEVAVEKSGALCLDRVDKRHKLMTV